MRNDPLRVIVAGPYRATDGYPNVKWFLHHIALDERFRIAYARSRGAQDGSFARSGLTGLGILRTGLRMFFDSLWSVGAAIRLWRNDKFDAVYLPYPALIPLLLFSLFPGRRPLIVADTFISLYDTVVCDRKLLRGNGVLGRMLYFLERRALSTADIVLTDTECNKHYLEKLFGLPVVKVKVLPLATDEVSYQPRPVSSKSGVCRILFVGTFVPLHGAETVARAALKLVGHGEIEFRIFGDGQTADLVEGILGQNPPNVFWHRGWSSPSDLAKEIENADICLGIFGATEKASRVWPLKNYAAMRVGRAVVTQETQCWPGASEHGLPAPFLMVPANDSDALAECLLSLVGDSKRREYFAGKASSYYEHYLSNRVVINQFYDQVCQALIR